MACVKEKKRYILSLQNREEKNPKRPRRNYSTMASFIRKIWGSQEIEVFRDKTDNNNNNNNTTKNLQGKLLDTIKRFGLS